MGINNMYDFSIVDKRINELINKIIFGAAIIILKGEEVIFFKCYGLANKEKNYPITPNSVFRLASNTKIITATAAVIAEQQGLFNLDDYVDKYIPEFKELYVKDENGNLLDEHPYRITIRQLLDHSSGFGCPPHESVIYDSLKKEERKDLKTAVNNYAKHPVLAFKPGSNRFYSALMAFDVVARIIEITSRMEYEEFLRVNVLEPLEMPHTAYSYDNIKEEDIVRRSIYDENNNLTQEKDNNETFDGFAPHYTGGGAGLVSTIIDYSHLMMMLTNKGVYKGKRILSEQAWNRFTEKRRVDYPQGGYDYWGCGVQFHLPDWGRLPKDAFCWSGAYGTHAWSDPINGISVVYMHNTNIPTHGGSEGGHIKMIENSVNNALGIELE